MLCFILASQPIVQQLQLVMQDVREDFQAWDEKLDLKIDSLFQLQRNRLQLEHEKFKFEKEKSANKNNYINCIIVSHNMSLLFALLPKIALAGKASLTCVCKSNLCSSNKESSSSSSKRHQLCSAHAATTHLICFSFDLTSYPREP